MFHLIGNSILGSDIGIGLIVLLTCSLFSITVSNGVIRMAEVSSRFTTDSLTGKLLKINSMMENEEIDSSEAKKLVTIAKSQEKFFFVILKLSYYLRTLSNITITVLLVTLCVKLSKTMLVQDALEFIKTYSSTVIGISISIFVILLFAYLFIAYLLKNNFDKNSAVK